MATKKERVMLTISEPVQNSLNNFWEHFPDLKGNKQESIQFLIAIGSAALTRNRQDFLSSLPMQSQPSSDTSSSSEVCAPEALDKDVDEDVDTF